MATNSLQASIENSCSEYTRRHAETMESAILAILWCGYSLDRLHIAVLQHENVHQIRCGDDVLASVTTVWPEPDFDNYKIKIKLEYHCEVRRP